MMHFTIKWSVERVVPIPNAEVEVPLWTEVHVNGGEKLLLLVTERIKSGQMTKG
jgi:hypothetical protein